MTPSLQTTPTVVVPFRTSWFGLFDIFYSPDIIFLSSHVQNSSGIRSVVFSFVLLISITVCGFFGPSIWYFILAISCFLVFFDMFICLFLFFVVFCICGVNCFGWWGW